MKTDPVLPVGVLGELVKVIKPVKPNNDKGLTGFATSAGITTITGFTFYQTIQKCKPTLSHRPRCGTPHPEPKSSTDRRGQARPADQILASPNPTEEISP
jgi:hypothetical protein